MMRIRPVTTLLIIFGTWWMAGCQQGDSLRGKVTYNGEPVETGSLTFFSADGSGPGFGAEVVNGEYKTDKIRLGRHTVYVRGLTKPPRLTKEQSIQAREQGDNLYGLPVEYIPETAKGNNQTLDIERGHQVLNFDIEGPPRPKSAQ